MNKEQKALLQAAGWEVKCLSPLELWHAQTHSIASELAAQAVIEQVENEASIKAVVAQPEWSFETLLWNWRDKLVLTLVHESPSKLVSVLDMAYRQLDAWQVAKGIRKQRRTTFKGSETLREEVADLVSRFVGDGSHGLQTGLSILLRNFVES